MSPVNRRGAAPTPRGGGETGPREQSERDVFLYLTKVTLAGRGHKITVRIRTALLRYRKT